MLLKYILVRHYGSLPPQKIIQFFHISQVSSKHKTPFPPSKKKVLKIFLVF